MLQITRPEKKERIGIRVRDSERGSEDMGLVGFGNVKVDQIESRKGSEDIDDEGTILPVRYFDPKIPFSELRARMTRRRSTVFAENLTEELGFPEVKINKDKKSERRKSQASANFKVAQNKLAMAASERRRSLAERRQSQGKG